jgi:hypothetical protein
METEVKNEVELLPPVVKEVERMCGRRKFNGEIRIEDGEYRYHYPEVAAIGRELARGDATKIAKICNVSRVYVCKVISGERFNAAIVREMIVFARQNAAMRKRFVINV